MNDELWQSEDGSETGDRAEAANPWNSELPDLSHHPDIIPIPTNDEESVRSGAPTVARERAKRMFARRRFLKVLAYGTAAAAGAGAVKLADSKGGEKQGAGESTTDSSSSTNTTAAAQAPSKPATATRATNERVLVVVEMSGGNDGLNTLVPYGDSAYAQLRTRTAINPDEVLKLGDGFGLHPNLKRLHQRGIAVVRGVGVTTDDGEADLSHFAMMQRWWDGDPAGQLGYPYGFLGRCCDTLPKSDAPLIGLTLGHGPTRALQAEKAVTVALPDPGSAWMFQSDQNENDWITALKRGLAAMAGRAGTATPAGPPPSIDSGRKGVRDAMALGQLLTTLPEAGEGYPGSELGTSLALTSRLIAGGIGVRVIHVPFGGDFDTHEDTLNRHGQLMATLDEALDAFLADLERRKLADRVLVMTTSEFGRRAGDNASSGLDHGTASVALLAGPVKTGMFGEPPSLTKLNEENLIATTSMRDYYATVVEGWLGLPAKDVLGPKAKPIAGVF